MWTSELHIWRRANTQSGRVRSTGGHYDTMDPTLIPLFAGYTSILKELGEAVVLFATAYCLVRKSTKSGSEKRSKKNR
jgi:hypothetical protein